MRLDLNIFMVICILFCSQSAVNPASTSIEEKFINSSSLNYQSMSPLSCIFRKQNSTELKKINHKLGEQRRKRDSDNLRSHLTLKTNIKLDELLPFVKNFKKKSEDVTISVENSDVVEHDSKTKNSEAESLTLKKEEKLKQISRHFRNESNKEDQHADDDKEGYEKNLQDDYKVSFNLSPIVGKTIKRVLKHRDGGRKRVGKKQFKNIPADAKILKTVLQKIVYFEVTTMSTTLSWSEDDENDEDYDYKYKNKFAQDMVNYDKYSEDDYYEGVSSDQPPQTYTIRIAVDSTVFGQTQNYSDSQKSTKPGSTQVVKSTTESKTTKKYMSEAIPITEQPFIAENYAGYEVEAAEAVTSIPLEKVKKNKAHKHHHKNKKKKKKHTTPNGKHTTPSKMCTKMKTKSCEDEDDELDYSYMEKRVVSSSPIPIKAKKSKNASIQASRMINYSRPDYLAEDFLPGENHILLKIDISTPSNHGHTSCTSKSTSHSTTTTTAHTTVHTTTSVHTTATHKTTTSSSQEDEEEEEEDDEDDDEDEDEDELEAEENSAPTENENYQDPMIENSTEEYEDYYEGEKRHLKNKVMDTGIDHNPSSMIRTTLFHRNKELPSFISRSSLDLDNYDNFAIETNTKEEMDMEVTTISENTKKYGNLNINVHIDSEGCDLSYPSNLKNMKSKSKYGRKKIQNTRKFLKDFGPLFVIENPIFSKNVFFTRGYGEKIGKNGKHSKNYLKTEVTRLANVQATAPYILKSNIAVNQMHYGLTQPFNGAVDNVVYQQYNEQTGPLNGRVNNTISQPYNEQAGPLNGKSNKVVLQTNNGLAGPLKGKVNNVVSQPYNGQAGSFNEKVNNVVPQPYNQQTGPFNGKATNLVPQTNIEQPRPSDQKNKTNDGGAQSFIRNTNENITPLAPITSRTTQTESSPVTTRKHHHHKFRTTDRFFASYGLHTLKTKLAASSTDMMSKDFDEENFTGDDCTYAFMETTEKFRINYKGNSRLKDFHRIHDDDENDYNYNEDFEEGMTEFTILTAPTKKN